MQHAHTHTWSAIAVRTAQGVMLIVFLWARPRFPNVYAPRCVNLRFELATELACLP
jgi:hypothetical protein